jgi:hypothetical protein
VPDFIHRVKDTENLVTLTTTVTDLSPLHVKYNMNKTDISLLIVGGRRLMKPDQYSGSFLLKTPAVIILKINRWQALQTVSHMTFL